MPRVAFALLTVAVFALGGATACSNLRPSSSDDGSPDQLDQGHDVRKVVVSPSQVELTINGGAQTVRFSAKSDILGDVTDQADWSFSDDGVGSIDKGRLTIGAAARHGGSFKVFARLGDGTGSATVNLKLVASDVVDPSAPPDAQGWFGGPGGGAAPGVTYPFDNTMMAPNILQLAIQWQAAGNSVFRLHFTGPTYERSFYVGSGLCSGDQCTFNVDDLKWSELGHAALEQMVKLEIAGVANKGGPIGASSPITIRFSPEDCRGGLYYFSPSIKGIKRVPIGASRPVDFIVNGNETGCAGCHAVSRDGKQVAIEYGSGQTNIGSGVVDGADSTMRNFPLSPDIAWNFSWFNPTGDKLLTNWTGTLSVRDPKNGQILSTVSTAQIGGPRAAMPEWSPDGRYIAFVREPVPTAASYDFAIEDSGDIVIMPYNNGAFGPAIELVHGEPEPGHDVHFWPSWSPDSKWLVFNSLTCAPKTCTPFGCTGGCVQYSAAKTRLRIVRAIGDAGNPAIGSKPIELVQGTHLPNNTNNWPKFAPFLQKGRYVFVVYSAKYGWGFNTNGTPQLFMFGMDLEEAKKGNDPSFQPFWLPFQDKDTGNHSAIWTTDVSCHKAEDCPAEFDCQGGSCVGHIG